MDTQLTRSHLTGLSNELIVEIITRLSSFDCLNNLMLADYSIPSIVHQYQYTICGSIIETQLGALWKPARQLLALQYKLNHAACDPPLRDVGLGVLQGGTKIGIAEIFQIMSNTREIQSRRNSFVGVVRKNSTRSREDLPTIDLTSEGLTADNILKIDRGCYSVWIILLACAPGLWKLMSDQRYKAKGHSMFKDLTVEEELEIHLERHSGLQEYINYEDKLVELNELLSVFGNCWLFKFLPNVEQDRPCERWCRENEDKLKAEARIQIHLHGSRKVDPFEDEASDLDWLSKLFMFSFH